MNARTAVQENARLANEIFNSAKEFSERKNITVEEAIDFKVSLMIKHAENDNNRAAIEIMGRNAKKLIF